MAMTKTLWSISALAVEFDMDRRTVAKRINHIKPASNNGESKQWLLADVVGALTNQPPAEQRHNFADMIAERLRGWEEIRSTPESIVPIEFFAEFIRKDPKIVLNQLRAGMPYKAEGDWATGEGFTIATAPALDWIRLMADPIESWGRSDLMRELGL